MIANQRILQLQTPTHFIKMNYPKTGIYTASLTPFTASYEPEIPALINHVQWLLENGADGVALLGSTGEANSMTLEQRQTIIEQSTGNCLQTGC